MPFSSATAVRRSILVIWIVLCAGLLGLVAATRLAPLTGHELIVIRGSSMAPAIPSGSLIAVTDRRLPAVEPGDVVTLRLENGRLMTHRVLRVTELPTGTHVETKGDGNAAADPVLLPMSATVGVVDAVLPYAGFLLAFLSLPTGVVSTVSLLLSLLCAAWAFDDRPAPRPPLPTAPARARSRRLSL